MVVAVVSKPARKKMNACAAASSMVRVVPAGGGDAGTSVLVYNINKYYFDPIYTYVTPVSVQHGDCIIRTTKRYKSLPIYLCLIIVINLSFVLQLYQQLHEVVSGNIVLLSELDSFINSFSEECRTRRREYSYLQYSGEVRKAANDNNFDCVRKGLCERSSSHFPELCVGIFEAVAFDTECCRSYDVSAEAC